MLFKTFFLIFPVFFISADVYSAEIDLGPLFHKNKLEKSYDILGPFITYKKDDFHEEFGFRPFFYRLEDRERELKETEVLYPIGSSKRKRNLFFAQALLHIISYRSETRENNFYEREFTFFPFIFYRSSDEDSRNHFAFAPFYGKLKDKFSKDEIKFYLLPLYLESKSQGEITKSIVWPFISFYSGDHDGIRLWPIWGYRTRESDNLDQKFALWPIYVRSEKMLYGEKVYSKSILPFYAEAEYFDVKQRTYFWPFINHIENKKKGIERWDVPWPFVNITRGTETQTRFFPFYSLSDKKGVDEDGFILWPIYRYKRISLENTILSKKSFLLFIYRDEQYRPIDEGGEDRRRIDFWPLFSYERDESESYFHLLTLFEPFIRSNDRLYRNFSPFWRIYERTKTKKEIYSSFLWNLYTMYRDENQFKIDIRPIIPLFSYEKMHGGFSFNLVGGLIGYKNREDGDILKIFYIPIKL